MSTIKGVLIDFGNTLAYVDDKRYREDIGIILRKHGYNTTVKAITPLLYDAYRSSARGEAKNIYEFWTMFLTSLNIPENPLIIRELTEARNHHKATMLKLYNRVIPVLSNLKKKYKLALVSNCSVGLSEILEAMDLTRFFECLVLSYEVRSKKPDRSMYHEALRRLKLPPEDCVFVSDEISDLEGARVVGLRTILVRQSEHTTDNANDPHFQPDYQCTHISQITQFL
jgi:HAD superfamily hydrolase (TIGR01509 family)